MGTLAGGIDHHHLIADHHEHAARTASGNFTSEARHESATLSDDRFPIDNKQSADAALHLRGHGTTPEERSEIIRHAAEYDPVAASKAREADKS